MSATANAMQVCRRKASVCRLAGRLAVEFFERDVDRAGQVLVRVFSGRQHLDQLGLLFAEQPLQ
jgi:hypothetical protein